MIHRALPTGSNLPTGQWVREGEWHVWREPTTRPFHQIRIDTTRMLHRGLAAILVMHEWRGQVCHWTALGGGGNGTVSLEGPYLTARLRFNWLSPTTYLPGFQQKVLSEVSAAVVETAGACFFGREVFLIHGHDSLARDQLKEMLRGFRLEPIVLAEQSDGGMTIVEKFEYYAGMCSFAFALMTPDDVLARSDAAGEIWRVRPNVILELGWFMARLGRNRVLMLLKGSFDIPSDLDGIIFLPFQTDVTEASPQIRLRLREVGLI